MLEEVVTKFENIAMNINFGDITDHFPKNSTLAHLAINYMVLKKTAHDKSMKSKLKLIQLKSSTSVLYVCNPFLMFKKKNIILFTF